MHIEHIAVWTPNLEAMRQFYQRYFGAVSGSRYDSERQPGYRSYFLTFPSGGSRVELMSRPDIQAAATGAHHGYAHIAIAVGSRPAVDALVERMRVDGVPIVSGPRRTGDGYYEAVVTDPDGNAVEITE